MKERYYAGIGSRDTPEEYLDLMRRVGAVLGRAGWTLRSGGASGADTAFEEGALSVNGKRRIYLPKVGFGPLPRVNDASSLVPDQVLGKLIWEMASELAAQTHPSSGAAWSKMDDFTRRLLTRNMFQVMGDNLQSPVTMVVCYGEKPQFDQIGRCVDVAGGTGQAVRLAAAENIRVHNIFVPEHFERVAKYVREQEAILAAQEQRLEQVNHSLARDRRRSP